MSKKSNSVLDKLMPLGTIQRRQRQKKESIGAYFNKISRNTNTFKKYIFFS